MSLILFVGKLEVMFEELKFLITENEILKSIKQISHWIYWYMNSACGQMS